MRLILTCICCGLMFLASSWVSAQEADMTFGEEETQGEPSGAEGEPAGGGESSAGDEDVLSTLGIGEETEEGAEGAPAEGQKRPAEGEAAMPKGEHPIWAVQQIYALKAGRFELSPFFSISLNDPYVVHSAFGVGLNYYITEVLALGVNFLWFYGFNAETDTTFHAGRSFRLAVPINEYQLGTNLNFSYVPLYGKFALFNEWIVHWDAWLSGGVGLMRSRPVQVIDPDFRTFDWNNLLSFNVGFGGRIFLSRFLAVFFEVRDYMFMEEVENQEAPNDPVWQENPDNWYGDPVFTSNVMVHVGVSIFIPFAFEYELTK